MEKKTVIDFQFTKNYKLTNIQRNLYAKQKYNSKMSEQLSYSFLHQNFEHVKRSLTSLTR